MSDRISTKQAFWLATLAAAALAGCDRASDGGGAVSAPSSLSGTVLYRERMALPDTALVEVRLEDVSRADAPADVLAQLTIVTGGRQVPIPFTLEYDTLRIEPNHRYGVRAAIRSADGQLLFATTTHQPVLDNGAPSGEIAVLVQRVAGDSGRGDSPDAAGAADSIPTGPWRLVAIERPGATEEAVREPAYTIAFDSNGRYSGQAHCNRFTGGYEQPEPGRLIMRGGAATLAACPEPSIADEFLRAIASVTDYDVSGDRLRLSYGSGALTFVRDSPDVATSEVARTFVFDCDGDVSFTVRHGPGEVALWAPQSLDGQYVVLGQTRSASGARYESDDTVYWNKGDVATFEHAGQTFTDCRSNPSKVPWADAARRGIIARALGNEPSWAIEIGRERLTMISDLGASRTELAYSEPVVAGGMTTYRGTGDGHEVVAILYHTPCTDTMSGDVFEVTANVTFDGTTFHGCGRTL